MLAFVICSRAIADAMRMHAGARYIGSQKVPRAISLIDDGAHQQLRDVSYDALARPLAHGNSIATVMRGSSPLYTGT